MEIDKRKFPLCLGEEDVKCTSILLSSSETRKWRNGFLSKEWLNMNDEIAYKKH
jgi:hypothetical protein